MTAGMSDEARERAIHNLWEYAQAEWNWGSDDYGDVERAVDVVLKATAPSSAREGGDGEPVPFTTSSRGFKHYELITSNSGDTVQVYESSAADAPYVWLASNGEPVHLRLEDAERLIATLQAALANHYQLGEEAPDAAA
jgi:hypothetical protein